MCAMDQSNIYLGDFWDFGKGTEFKGHIWNNFAVEFIDDNLFATGGEDMSVRIWDKRNNIKSV